MNYHVLYFNCNVLCYLYNYLMSENHVLLRYCDFFP